MTPAEIRLKSIAINAAFCLGLSIAFVLSLRVVLAIFLWDATWLDQPSSGLYAGIVVSILWSALTCREETH